MKVCIDPGHGGTDPGDIGVAPGFRKGKDVNLEIAVALEAELERLQESVMMTRRGHRARSLSTRAIWACRAHGLDLAGVLLLLLQ